MNREDFMYCISIVAQRIYDAEEQVKYYFNQMKDEPDEEEWEDRYSLALYEATSYRNEYVYLKELEDAIEFLRACELQSNSHPDYSYEEQMDILKKAVEKGLKFDLLKLNYYYTEDCHKIVTALATTNFTDNKQFQDFFSTFEPM